MIKIDKAYNLIRYSTLSDYGIKKKTGITEGELQVLKELVMEDVLNGSPQERIIASIRARESIVKDIRMQVARKLLSMNFQEDEVMVICQLFKEELDYAKKTRNSLAGKILSDETFPYKDDFSWSIATQEFSRIQEILKGMDTELTLNNNESENHQ